MNVTTPEVGFSSATLALRPPRVAMMVADDEHWRDWTMTALGIASGYWGGAGFILVPFDFETGTPAAEFADIVRAYDQDHVVTLQVPLATFEGWYPGSIVIDGTADDAERLQMIANAQMEIDGTSAAAARIEVASWCSPMRVVRHSGEPGTRGLETITTLRRRKAVGDRLNLGLAPAPSAQSDARIAAAESWRSDLGLMAALRVGIADTEPEQRPEPPANGLSWLIRPVNEAPTSLIWNRSIIPTQSSTGLEPWFSAEQGLVQVSNFYLEDRAAIVVGNTGKDFALALAYDRLIGNGIWITPALLDDADLLRHEIQPTISLMISELERAASRVVVTSTSATEEYLNEVPKRVQGGLYGIQFNGSEQGTIRIGRAKVAGGYFAYVVNEHVGVSVSIPVSKMPDGSAESLSGLETPVPTTLIRADGSGWVPYWYVDVNLGGDRKPSGRDLPARALLVDEGAYPLVNLRSSRDSVTFDPHSMGFVSAGSFLPGRIGRPRFREVSMRAWVEAMAEPAGLGVRLSSAGRQAELLRRRLGSRDNLLDLVNPANVVMLRAFAPMTKRPVPSERDSNAVVLGLDPYLTFEAIDALLPGGSDETSALVDQLISTRLLRRGLILDCVECGRPSFYDVDRLGQTFECLQCSATNALVSGRWKRKTNEPLWFYDLYTVFRQLLGANGDVVLLSAAALRKSSRTYLDAPELEFFELVSGLAVAEIDVIASVDRDVVLVEAKSNGAFSARTRSRQTQKLLRVARALRADRLVLATTKDHWNAEDLTHVASEAAKVKPFPVSVDVAHSLAQRAN